MKPRMHLQMEEPLLRWTRNKSHLVVTVMRCLSFLSGNIDQEVMILSGRPNQRPLRPARYLLKRFPSPIEPPGSKSSGAGASSSSATKTDSTLPQDLPPHAFATSSTQEEKEKKNRNPFLISWLRVRTRGCPTSIASSPPPSPM